MIEINKIYCENCLDTMARMPDNFIDLTVTSPPYDNLRDYHGYSFDFKPIAKELFRVTKQGGVVVWVVGDQTVNGSETGTSFKQALYFKYIGFLLHDTMIYEKTGIPFPGNTRYNSTFEYMFVFSKEKPKTKNLIQDKTNKYQDYTKKYTFRKKGGECEGGQEITIKEKGVRNNIWKIPTGYLVSYKESYVYNHPATFPEQLANDHIISWSNKHDIIYDPFSGSGTTAKMAKKNQRNYIGSEISQIYCDIANKRITETPIQFDIFD